MTKAPIKILFAGGGTGGHLFSGIAVAERLRESRPEAEILFVGTPFGLEKDIVPSAGFPLRTIEATPLKGSGLGARLRSLARLPKAYRQSRKILREFRPDVVVGIGGYASGPMTLAAHFAKIPTAIIEQNSIPGFTNRKLARFADRIFIAFAKAREFFDPRKTRLTGNPTRRFSAPEERSPGERFCLFVLGGSQGAHSLNEAMIAATPKLAERSKRLHIVHQTGGQDEAEVAAAYRAAGLSAEVFSFSQHLSPYYAKADLMLCRAGAGTITELQNLGLPAILVPYPFAADDHQRYNAEAMVVAGAAEMILNRDLQGARVAERLAFYVDHPEALEEMRRAARGLAKPEAAQEVLAECLELITRPVKTSQPQ
ncbi:MAG: undecaprenyldiphospho-muramoylpentapeptide beta-N-acetylglucosaminyltransferase [Deltaproteobacteria bacterium]|nr:undecaprenyldiphospho-muramoylpentapeptide beta-N-acetylglucosaminyltransferase [Deltaproteobacteria bacterium]